MTTFQFISCDRLYRDVIDWSTKLPRDFIAVAGVPRSGLLPALQLSLLRNIHLVTLRDLCANKRPWEVTSRRNVTAHKKGRVLVLEDSCNSGNSLKAARLALRGCTAPLVFGSVYVRRPEIPGVDVFYRHVPAPRAYEWNIFHSKQTSSMSFDLDGVFCVEPAFKEYDDGPQRKLWLNHLANAVPKFIPTFPVQAVVTSRLDKYRKETAAWLSRYGIQYGKLVMSPHPTAQARRRAGDHAKRKAEFYGGSESMLFVESSSSQAAKIAKLSRRPVLCTDTMTLYQGS